MTETRLGYMPALDGLRAVAIILVVGYHAFAPGFGFGTHGVDVFFVLSGFLITALIANQIKSEHFSKRRFYARRAIRLVPGLVVCVVIFTPIGIAVMHGQNTVMGAILALTYLTPFGPVTIFDHTWTLALEEWFYLVWPLVLRKLFRDRLTLRQAAALIAAGAIAAQAAMVIQPGSLIARPSTLLAGAALALWWLDGGRLKVPRVALTVGVSLILVSVFAGPILWAPVPYWLSVVGTASAIGGAASGAGGPLARSLELRPLVAIGVVSYEWYLLHPPMLKLSARLWGTESGLIVVPVSLAAAFVLHLATSPLQAKWRRRFAGRTDTAMDRP